jgi:hypothetical protein
MGWRAVLRAWWREENGHGETISPVATGVLYNRRGSGEGKGEGVWLWWHHVAGGGRPQHDAGVEEVGGDRRGVAAQSRDMGGGGMLTRETPAE